MIIFEQALIDLGLDSGPLDDLVPTANINGITALDLEAKKYIRSNRYRRFHSPRGT